MPVRVVPRSSTSGRGERSDDVGGRATPEAGEDTGLPIGARGRSHRRLGRRPRRRGARQSRRPTTRSCRARPRRDARRGRPRWRCPSGARRGRNRRRSRAMPRPSCARRRRRTRARPRPGRRARPAPRRRGCATHHRGRSRRGSARTSVKSEHRGAERRESPWPRQGTTMSLKPLFRELRQAVLGGMRHADAPRRRIAMPPQTFRPTPASTSWTCTDSVSRSGRRRSDDGCRCLRRRGQKAHRLGRPDPDTVVLVRHRRRARRLRAAAGDQPRRGRDGAHQPVWSQANGTPFVTDIDPVTGGPVWPPNGTWEHFTP